MNLFTLDIFVFLILLAVCHGSRLKPYLMVSVPNTEPAYLCGSESDTQIEPVNLTMIQASSYRSSESTAINRPYAIFVDVTGFVWTDQPEPTLVIVDDRINDTFVTGKFVIHVNGKKLAQILSRIRVAQSDIPTISVLNTTKFTERYRSFYGTIPGLYAVISVLLGSMMTFINTDRLRKKLDVQNQTLKGKSWTMYLAILLLCLLSTGMLLVYYYFYDIAVYFLIGLFACGCIFVIPAFFTTWIGFIFPVTDKRFPIKFPLCGRHVTKHIHLVFCVLLPVGIIYAVFWIGYRNDPNIGNPLLSVAAVMIVAYFLSNIVPLPSLKLITFFFALYMAYDVFMVYITPLFKSNPSMPASDTILNRTVRSLPSVMEAVATGSAGRSGESLPGAFKVKYRLWLGPSGAQCNYVDATAMLGFGDAIVPGILCAYTMFYDSVWKVRFRYNALGSIIGYVLGVVVVELVAMKINMGHPALLFICPISLVCTVASALSFGGSQQLTRLWHGQLLSLPTSSAGGDASGEQSAGYVALQGAQSTVTLDEKMATDLAGDGDEELFRGHGGDPQNQVA